MDRVAKPTATAGKSDVVSLSILVLGLISIRDGIDRLRASPAG